MRYNNSYVRNSQDRIIASVIVFQISIVASKNMMASTLQVVNDLNYRLNIFITGIILLLYLYCFYRTRIRIRKKSFYIILASFVFFLGTYLLNYELFTYRYIIPGLQTFLVYCLPLLIFVPLLYDVDELINKFYRASYFMSIVALVTFMLIIFGLETIRGYSMSYGLNTMISTIFLFSNAFKENNFRDYILAGSCTATIFILGSRWPLLCISAFIVYGLIMKVFASKKHGFLLIVLVSILCLVYINHTKILIETNTFLNRFGFTSRTINMALNENVTYDSGRTQIHRELFLKLGESPLLGYGAFGGVVALGGESPHSLLLDIWANFGYIVGSIILIYSIYMTIKCFWINRESSYGELIAIYACMVWPKAAIGGSFWSLEPYWMLTSLFLLGSNLKVKNNGEIHNYGETS